MRDANYSLQKAYFTALTGITYDGIAVPVFYMTMPDNANPDNYIIFGPVTNNDISTKGSADTSSLMRVTIHTQNTKYNPGKAANFIAGEVLNRIYPTTQAFLDLSADNLQMVAIEIASDTTMDYKVKNAVSFIDRVLIFRQKVYHIN